MTSDNFMMWPPPFLLIHGSAVNEVCIIARVKARAKPMIGARQVEMSCMRELIEFIR